RTALVGIEGFSEVIRDSEQLDLEEVKAFASDIHNDAERLDQAFARMLTLDEMEAGRVALDRSRADLNARGIDVVERAQKQTPAAVITITPDPSSRVVDCDHARVQQLLSSLIDNAIRYSPAASQVDVAVARRADEVEVAVSDLGPGMAADDGIAAAAGNGARGTGLGLPIARQIVRLHGGRIWFISKPGQGTQVHFTLPAAAADGATACAAATLAAEGEIATTVELLLDFFRPARPGHALAKGTVLDRAGHLVYCAAMVEQLGVVVAEAHATVALVRRA